MPSPSPSALRSSIPQREEDAERGEGKHKHCQTGWFRYRRARKIERKGPRGGAERQDNVTVILTGLKGVVNSRVIAIESENKSQVYGAKGWPGTKEIQRYGGRGRGGKPL